MKNPVRNTIALTFLVLGGPVRADIVYSNVNTGIASTYTGTTVNVGDGSLNLFFGGAGLANNSALQPFRIGTGTVDGMNTILNLSNNTFVSVSSGGLATGAGGSIDHLGSQFSVGTDGYLGFKLDDADYGWMRVRFTYGTSGGVVRDWAFDNAGAAIKTGWINTDVVSSTAQTITLNPATGEAFTLSSTTPLVNAGATITNSVVKNGAGTAILTGINTYTGSTAINAGTLVVNGSTASGSAVSVAAGSATGVPVATLGGTGTIGGNVTLAAESSSGFSNGGILAPTANASGTPLSVTGTTTFNTGSIFEWDLNAATSDTGATNQGDYGRLAGTGTISGGDAIFKIVLGSNAFTDDFWNTDKTWTNVFGGAGATLNLSDIFLSFSGNDISSSGAVAGQGRFTFSGTNTLAWAALPEPTGALAGLLLGSGLLRRRR